MCDNTHKKILFLSTHNLATNPRLVKEAELALNNGFSVEIICFEFNNWSFTNNQVLKEKLKLAQIHAIPAGRRPILPWLFSTIEEKYCRFLSRFFELPVKFLSQAISRRNALLIKQVKKIDWADLVIAHNPGAFWSALWFAQKKNCKIGIDVEDYHPGEGNNKLLNKLTITLMKHILPRTNYVSFASPLIQKETEKLIHTNKDHGFTVMNYFPLNEFIEPIFGDPGIIKLVWFSQNINSGRGLEIILPVIKEMHKEVELHLIGNINNVFAKKWIDNLPNVIVHPACDQLELHKKLSQFDIGLALDVPVDRNREIAITNKLVSYLQAGLYVIATNTEAHADFMDKFSDFGICFNYRTNNFKEKLRGIIDNIYEIRENKVSRYNKFRKYSWENESVVLLNNWKKLIIE